MWSEHLRLVARIVKVSNLRRKERLYSQDDILMQLKEVDSTHRHQTALGEVLVHKILVVVAGKTMPGLPTVPLACMMFAVE